MTDTKKKYSTKPITLKGEDAANARRFIALWRKCDSSTWEEYLNCGNRLSKAILGDEHTKNNNSLFQ